MGWFLRFNERRRYGDGEFSADFEGIFGVAKFISFHMKNEKLIDILNPSFSNARN